MDITRRAIFAQAWPIILGQALVPLVSVVDVAVIGRLSDGRNLGGVALGTTILNLVFWSFGFLRMGVTGITAQAKGAREDGEVCATILRSLVLGLGLGAMLLAVSPVIVPVGLHLMAAPAGVEGLRAIF